MTGFAANLLAADRPHIILMMTDDQGYGDVSYYGHAELKTPNLDAMAAAGMRFDRFYAADSVCSPSRGGFITGRYPNRFRCYDWGYDMPTKEITIAEVLQKNGYATSHFGKWHLGGLAHAPGGTNRGGLTDEQGGVEAERDPGHQGFDYFYSAGNWYDIGFNYLYENGVERKVPEGVDTADDLIDKATKHFDQVLNTDKPIFAVIWFPSPHLPHKALPSDRKPYEKYSKKKPDYYGELTGVDRAVGRLRSYLKDKQITDNTMLWFTSDNGPYAPGSTAGLRGFKYTYFEGGMRVPGILEWPAVVKKPAVCNVPCTTLDYFPTIMKMLGIDMPTDRVYDGIDITPIIKGQVTQRDKPIFFEARDRKHGVGEVVVVDNDYKLKLFLKSNRHSRKRDGERSALFNLIEDRAEEKNRFDAPAQAERRAVMTKMIEQWQQSVEADIAKYK